MKTSSLPAALIIPAVPEHRSNILLCDPIDTILILSLNLIRIWEAPSGSRELLGEPGSHGERPGEPSGAKALSLPGFLNLEAAGSRWELLGAVGSRVGRLPEASLADL